MYFVLVTVLALGAQPVPPGASYPPPPPQAMGEAGYEDYDSEACRARGGGPGIAARVGAAYQHLAYKVATCAMEPQTNYNPRFGCYGSNDRFMHRYPAFHGHYYRRPYNYRTQFDYPWHAEMHEPTSLFSYNFANEEVGAGPPRPEPVPQSSRRDPQSGNSGKNARPTTMQPVSIRPVKSAYTIKSEDGPNSDDPPPSPSDRR